MELAFVALLIITICAGAFDYGMAWREALATNEAARTAARTGSALADNVQADYYALSGAKAALTNSGRINDVQKVVIYKSTTVDGNVPALCTTASSSSLPCIVLTGAQFRAMTLADFDTVTGCFTPATIKNWCPLTRNNVQLTADYYGIWIQTKYTHQFKLIANATTVNRDAVMRLEPEVS
ncbi:TadE/TadG family type IV pilus assembly protein [Aquihabitans sp. McL0605]|uniref:TadE/TadG family type IV pilus assembly protein n=1 Tax=Aquihabitans sp. McL0605 TaxID=3415671 RepID=UPI003CF9D6B8